MQQELMKAPRPEKRNRGQRRNQSPRPSQESPNLGKELDPSRRRRLILQEESEEDFVVHEVPMQNRPLETLGKGGSASNNQDNEQPNAPRAGLPSLQQNMAKQAMEPKETDRDIPDQLLKPIEHSSRSGVIIDAKPLRVCPPRRELVEHGPMLGA
ncbi:unnamed protein product [Linum trigynum]|uniref:Uncharacterized protein n=1 Tax=Linum trigynum TaxID=586398 RepID=A0AAV2DZ96_9ROSI